MKSSYQCFILFLTIFLSSKSFGQNKSIQLMDRDLRLVYESILDTQKNIHLNQFPLLMSDSLKAYSGIKMLNKLNEKLEIQRSNFSLDFSPIMSGIAGLYKSSKSLYFYQDLGFQTNFSLKNKLQIQINIVHAISDTNWAENRRSASINFVPNWGRRISNANYYQYLPSNGFISFHPSNHFSFLAGKGKHFIGEGFRSLHLSENANQYYYFKATAQVWKLKFDILWAKLQDIDSLPSHHLQEKWMAVHTLSYNVNRFLNIYAFESVVWSSKDSSGYRGFEWNYINPFVFYRPTEFDQGSPDNILLGIGASVRLFNNYKLYFQGILDEFELRHIKARDGYWSNKYGIQCGLKTYHLFGIRNLFALMEVNYLRPFLYSHQNPANAYGNSLQALAHPFGANVQELILNLHYHHRDYIFSLKSIYTEYGVDGFNDNYGQNIYQSYNSRSQEFNNKVGQGIKTKRLFGELKLLRIINSRSFLCVEAGIKYFKQSPESTDLSGIIPFIGIRSAIFSDQKP